MLSLDPFTWWIITISWSIVFLILVSIYLYSSSRLERKDSIQPRPSRFRVCGDFVFVWVLVGLLAFYIISVNIGSAMIFAVGNIIVEGILIAYLLRNRQEKSEQTPNRHTMKR